MKRINVKVYLTLLVISFFAEIIFVSQSKRDWLSIIGVGIVILVSMYLAVDSFQNQQEIVCTRIISSLNESKNAYVQRIETVNKAVYVSLKKNMDEMKEEFQKMQQNLCQNSNSMEGVAKESAKVDQMAAMNKIIVENPTVDLTSIDLEPLKMDSMEMKS